MFMATACSSAEGDIFVGEIETGETGETLSLEVHAWASDVAGFDTTSYWVDTGEEVIVFDAQFAPRIADQLIASIQSETDSPIRWVVVTHPNPDKFNGATAFQAIGAQVVASQATAAAMPEVHAYKEAYFVGAGVFEEGSYPAMPDIDVEFDNELSLELVGAGSITLRTLDNGGVTTTQTIAIIDDGEGPRDIVVGDLVAGRAHAWLEGGLVDGVATPNLYAWYAALNEVAALAREDDRVLPGRGDILAVGLAVSNQQAYLDDLEAIVGGVLANYDNPVAALGGAEADAIYAEITAQAEAAFPEYRFSYLVTYGVYGLAWQLAQG